MTKKYEILHDESITHVCDRLKDSHKVYMIRALKTFETLNGITVKKGEYGGWVENENSLSQDGNCWSFGTSVIFDNARVEGDAVIAKGSFIRGNVIIRGKVQVGFDCLIDGMQLGQSIVQGHSEFHDIHMTLTDCVLPDACMQISRYCIDD